MKHTLTPRPARWVAFGNAGFDSPPGPARLNVMIAGTAGLPGWASATVDGSDGVPGGRRDAGTENCGMENVLRGGRNAGTEPCGMGDVLRRGRNAGTELEGTGRLLAKQRGAWWLGG